MSSSLLIVCTSPFVLTLGARDFSCAVSDFGQVLKSDPLLVSSAFGRRNEAPRRTREKPLAPSVLCPLHACENFICFCIFFLRENSSSQNLLLFTYGDQQVLGFHFFLIHTRWKITKLAEVNRQRSEIYVTLQRFENCSKKFNFTVFDPHI